MSRWLLAGLLCATAPLAAQDQAPDSLVVYPGAVVREGVPSMNLEGRPGKFASGKVRNTLCYGVAVTFGSSTAPSLVLLKGVSRLEVDRRTNIGIPVLGLEPAADSDWVLVDLTRLREQDHACALQGKPAS